MSFFLPFDLPKNDFLIPLCPPPQSRVSPIDPESVRTKAAYLLFYRRRTARPIGAKSRELVESAIQSRNGSRAVSAVPSPSLSRAASPEGLSRDIQDDNSNELASTSYGVDNYPSGGILGLGDRGMRAATPLSRYGATDSDDARSDTAADGRGSPTDFESFEDSDDDYTRRLLAKDPNNMRSWEREEYALARGLPVWNAYSDDIDAVDDVVLDHHKGGEGEDLDSV